MAPERFILLGQIRHVSISNLQDDWIAFALASNTEPDIFFSCVFKTELITRLKILMPGLDIRIGPTYTI